MAGVEGDSSDEEYGSALNSHYKVDYITLPQNLIIDHNILNVATLLIDNDYYP